MFTFPLTYNTDVVTSLFCTPRPTLLASVFYIQSIKTKEEKETKVPKWLPILLLGLIKYTSFGGFFIKNT